MLWSCHSAVRGPGGTAATTPPDDFWISISVIGPTDRTPTAAAALARSLRPGRYVVEPDRVLRVSQGPGAAETSFPPPTRTLGTAEYADLWRQATGAGLLDPGHPNIASGSGALDPETIQGKTVAVIVTHAFGRRELVSLELDPECAGACGKVKPVIDWLAGRAWIGEPKAAPGGAVPASTP